MTPTQAAIEAAKIIDALIELSEYEMERFNLDTVSITLEHLRILKSAISPTDAPSCPDGLHTDDDDCYQMLLKWKNNYEHLNSHSREQARENDQLKQELAKANIQLAKNRKAPPSNPQRSPRMNSTLKKQNGSEIISGELT